MPRGIPNKTKEVIAEPKAEVKVNVETKEEKKEIVSELLSKPKLEVLSAGQAYFEAPDGTIIIGEDSKDQIWYRAGKIWINRKR